MSINYIKLLKETVRDSFAIFGVIIVAFLSFVFIHEYGHVQINNELGVKTNEFVILGISDLSNNESAYAMIGWVRPKIDLDSNFNFTEYQLRHNKYDCQWRNPLGDC